MRIHFETRQFKEHNYLFEVTNIVSDGVRGYNCGCGLPKKLKSANEIF